MCTFDYLKEKKMMPHFEWTNRGCFVLANKTRKNIKNEKKKKWARTQGYVCFDTPSTATSVADAYVGLENSRPYILLRI